MKVKTFPAETRRVVEHLRETFRRAGHGSMARVAQTLGLHGTFYSEKRHRGRFDVGALVATLRELDISPAAFFAELEGDPGGGSLWGPLRERPTPDTRRAVRLAYRRMRAELGAVDLVAELEDGASGEEISAPGGPALGAEWLASLDGRRQDEPEAVAAEVAAGLDRVEAALLPAALGVWCSALRLLLELETAAYLNHWAVRLAQAAGDSATVADLYVRRSYIVADVGDHARALTLAELAAGIFARLGDQAGEGRALVDCGRFLHYLSRNRESIAALERALELLPESLPRIRYSALHSLGEVYLDLNELDMASRTVELATPLAVLAGSQDRGKLLWLQASICRKHGRLAESEALFRQVVEVFRTLHPGEATLASLELVEVILEQGKAREAWQVCLSMFPLEEENPIISAAVGKLIRAGVGGLHLERVRRVKAQLEDAKRDARTRREWCALAMVP